LWHGFPNAVASDGELLAALLEYGDSSPLCIRAGSTLMPDDTRERDRLVERIRRLPAEKLRAAEDLLAALECRDFSRISSAPPQHDTPDSSHAKDWPHAPVHRLSDCGTYLVTAGTLYKEHCFRGPDALNLLQSALF
jgi:hypothetical protein